MPRPAPRPVRSRPAAVFVRLDQADLDMLHQLAAREHRTSAAMLRHALLVYAVHYSVESPTLQVRADGRLDFVLPDGTRKIVEHEEP